MKNYKKTKIACYLGFITQAIAANFAPLLFLKFHMELSLHHLPPSGSGFTYRQIIPQQEKKNNAAEKFSALTIFLHFSTINARGKQTVA